MMSPFGVAWFFVYGYEGVPAACYMPELRKLGADFTKVYLFWQQLEPEKGRFDWTASDAFADQLNSPEEGLISLFSSSAWAVQKPSAMLPPSPANNLEDYYDFVYELVKRYKGRVRYWQNDCEPNNPVFWSGTAHEFVAQLKVFYHAVKDADPDALVLAGGYDGMFVPPSMKGQRPPFPQQDASLAFFDTVLKEAADAFDIFDLRLYGDPYSIVPRVDFMREKMLALGYEKPILCTEYGGPNLFEFAENRKYLPLVVSWSQAMAAGSQDNAVTDQIAELYRDINRLAPQTQMFMQGCAPALDAKYHRIQSRSLVMRNLFALSAGVERTLYWDLLDATGPRNDLMTLMYGKIGLIGSGDRGLTKITPTASAFACMAKMLQGIRGVKRLEVADRPSIFLFQADRGGLDSVYVVWERRDAFSGEDMPPVRFKWPWAAESAAAHDTFGTAVPVKISDGHVHLDISVTPVYLHAGD